jgi:hypothetical protein
MFYDLCNEIWSGCPATTSMENGLDAGDMAVVKNDTTKTVEDDENGTEITVVITPHTYTSHLHLNKNPIRRSQLWKQDQRM